MIQLPEASPLERVFAPLTDCLTPDVARRIVDARLDPQVQTRMNELSPKANFGALSDAERSEYEALIDGVDLWAIFKAKARRILAEQAQQ